MNQSVVHPLPRPTRSQNYGILALKATPTASSAGTRTSTSTSTATSTASSTATTAERAPSRGGVRFLSRRPLYLLSS
uniref:Uncharacterized protein n=1 Tax=Cucumis melo TaxID=3656 RepID=A0A9I9E582_CUCME